MPNFFLASLPTADYQRLEPHLEPVDLTAREYLHRSGEPVEHCYLPSLGAVSDLVSLQDGSEVEAGMIGRDGIVGLSALITDGVSVSTTVVQLPGKGMRMQAVLVREQMMISPAVRDRVLRFSLAHTIQIAQTAACNARHNLAQRLARWLLMALDRANSSVLPLTHDVLATMLGVRRPGVSVAAQALQQAGAIHYGRGRITILDRRRVEQMSCECYGAVRDRRKLLLDWTGCNPVSESDTN